MYNLNFETENIFKEDFPYKIHCIGKYVKGRSPYNHEARYFFVSHGKKYEVIEILHGLEDVNVIVRMVDEYTLPDENNIDYAIFKREVSYGIKYDMIKQFEDMTYSKDGFVIFKQMYAMQGGAALGGIDDVYEYEKATYKSLRKRLDEVKYDK